MGVEDDGGELGDRELWQLMHDACCRRDMAKLCALSSSTRTMSSEVNLCRWGRSQRWFDTHVGGPYPVLLNLGGQDELEEPGVGAAVLAERVENRGEGGGAQARRAGAERGGAHAVECRGTAGHALRRGRTHAKTGCAGGDSSGDTS